MIPAKTAAVFRAARIPHQVNNEFSVTQAIIQVQRELPYEEMWKTAYDNSWFHIQFEDLSLIQFQNVPSPSFHFLECPLDVPTQRELLASLGMDFRQRHDSDFLEVYAEAVATAGYRRHITPIRYDRDFGSYRPGVHPAAHLHIGLDNDVRIALTREMTPMSFILFVIRQKYPANWDNVLKSDLAQTLERKIRLSLTPLAEKYWQKADTYELSLW
jgi:hypothetical protein